MNINKFLLYTIITGSICITACRKTVNSSNPTSNLVQLIRADSSHFSILLQLFSVTHLSDTLQSAGTFTLFAPPDTAFLNAGITLDSLKRMRADVRLRMAKYYVSYGSYPIDSFPAGWEKPVRQLGLSIDNYQPNRYAWLTWQPAWNQYSINGVPLINAGIAASNGLLYIIGHTLDHTSVDIATTLKTDPRLGYVFYYTQMTDNWGNPLFNQTISNHYQSQYDTTQKTIFYPDSLSMGTLATTAHNNNSSVYLLPDYYTVSQPLFKPDFYYLNQEQVITNYNNPTSQTMQFLLNPGPAVLGYSNSQPANIKLPSCLVTTNGIIYVVDQTLTN